MRVLFIQHQDDCPPGLIGEHLADLGAELDVVPARSARLPNPSRYNLVVPLGSDDSAADEAVPYLRAECRLLQEAVRSRVPVFGICFGAQLLCRVLGGRVRVMPLPEIGWFEPEPADGELIGRGPWLTWHLDALTPGPRSSVVARTGRAVQAFVHGPHVGVQFHPEATVDSIAIWAEHYRDTLARVDLDPAEVVAAARSRASIAASSAHTLTDRVLQRMHRSSRRAAVRGA